MSKVNFSDSLPFRTYKGEIEFIIRDRHGNIIDHRREPNIIKIFAKEMLSHRIAHSKVWDPTAGSGVGAWVANTVDPSEEFSVKYIVFGASFDSEGTALGEADTRFYTLDTITNRYIPVNLEPGAWYDGGLINPIPIAEPDRPLKRVEDVTFQATYQPTGTPLLQEDVRALNNVVRFETTLKVDEYNGLGLTGSDSFTITEVALTGGAELGVVGTCECDPHELFLEGSANGDAILISFTGSNVVSIDAGEPTADLDVISVGDQVKIVDAGDTAGDTVSLQQVSPYYLVIGKSVSGRDIELDRTPVDSDNVPLTGSAGIFRDTFRIFSHRILQTPVPKSADQEITVIWTVIFS